MIGMSTVKLRDRRASKLGAMSGWEPSMPVSMMPTRVRWSPMSTLWACGAPIASMSHCSGVSGSGVATSAWSGSTAGRPAGGHGRASGADVARSASSRSISPAGRGEVGTRPITLSRAAPSTALVAETWLTNEAFDVGTFRTPTASFVRVHGAAGGLDRLRRVCGRRPRRPPGPRSRSPPVALDARSGPAPAAPAALAIAKVITAATAIAREPFSPCCSPRSVYPSPVRGDPSGPTRVQTASGGLARDEADRPSSAACGHPATTGTFRASEPAPGSDRSHSRPRSRTDPAGEPAG